MGLTRADIELAIEEWRETGEDAFHQRFGTRPAAKFLLVDSEGWQYDAKAVLFGARRLRGLDGDNRDFDGDRATVAEPLEQLGFEVREKVQVPGVSPAAIDEEVLRRREMLRAVKSQHDGLHGVPSSTVNDLRIFWGGRGVWYDAARTRTLCAPGVTVGVLHTGSHYAVDLTADGVVYHYPDTASPEKDAAEIEATKNAGRLEIPIFVVVKRRQRKDVHLGWIAEWDDTNGEFLILYGDQFPTGLDLHTAAEDESDFIAFESKAGRRQRMASVRPNQAQFSFAVRKRYGSVCGACGLTAPSLIDAAHVIPDAKGGSSDARNGLTLCPTHHRAFDLGLIRVIPTDCSWTVGETSSLGLAELGVTRPNLDHLAAKPHRKSLDWRWQNDAKDEDSK